MKVISNREIKEQTVKILKDIIKEIKNCPELLEADLTTNNEVDFGLYQATGIHRIKSKTYELHLKLKA